MVLTIRDDRSKLEGMYVSATTLLVRGAEKQTYVHQLV